jgi:hypothetical protein
VSTFLYALFYSMAEIFIDFVPKGQIPSSLHQLLKDGQWVEELRPIIRENVKLCSVGVHHRPMGEGEVDGEEHRSSAGRILEDGRAGKNSWSNGRKMVSLNLRLSLSLLSLVT